MKREQIRQRIVKGCDDIKRVDDALGKFSDYEGGTDGPTWQAYKDGYLPRRALEAIQLHRDAIAAWGKLYNLSRPKAKSS